MDTTYRIAEVAERSGLKASTLRYYEDIGLLPAPERTAHGYRAYGEDVLDRLAFVARAKQLGCTLGEIAGLLAARDTDRCEPVQTRLRQLVAAKIAGARERAAEIARLPGRCRAGGEHRHTAGSRRHRPRGPTRRRPRTSAGRRPRVARPAPVGAATGGLGGAPTCLSTALLFYFGWAHATGSSPTSASTPPCSG